MLKQKILSYLANQTAFFDPENISDIFTASHIADKFDIKRNTASLYLNELVTDKKVIKIISRPVYFLHKTVFENQFFNILEYQYPSVSALFANQPQIESNHDLFSLVIGHNQSLKKPIEQLKMAMLYPNGGLPLLIGGSSGTGKSYLANLLYQYCITNQLIDENAPFVTFNCAQYANNPELLTSNLFGYVKGAFTGADHARQGAFEHANGGILFLDEVHRLNGEGQEKLFTYLDNGIIYRMGDTKNSIPLHVRLIFATTENLNDNFMRTFLRRIPVQVTLPDLEDRTKQEKEQLIYLLFRNEAKIIDRKLSISPQTLINFKNQHFIGNIGSLENAIKNTVAYAFAKQVNQDLIKITIYDIPQQFINQQFNPNSQLNESNIEIDKTTDLGYLIHQSNPINEMIYDAYIKLSYLFKKNPQQIDITPDIENELLNEIDRLFDKLIYENKQQNQNIIKHVINTVTYELQNLEQMFNVQFNGNYIYAISYYLYYRANFEYQFNQINFAMMKSIQQAVKKLNPHMYRLVKQLFRSIENKIDLQTQAVDIIILTLYLNKMGGTENSGLTKAIILAHGYATASSIANVTNRLLGKNVFEAFDMPIDIAPQDIANKVINYIERNDISRGLLILVDMGSLKDIYKFLPHTINSPIAIINNVSTQIAMNIGSLILDHIYLEKIIEEVIPKNIPEHNIIYPNHNKPKAIITTCVTGIGTANKIKTLLKDSITNVLNIEIIAYDFQALERDKGTDSIFLLYNVIAIIGTLNPNIADVPFISLEELISGNTNSILLSLLHEANQQTIQEINNSIIKNFSLERVIESVTILDTNKVINYIEQCIIQFENITQQALPNDKKIALYIHISCLIERLIRNVPLENHIHQTFQQCQKVSLQQIKEACSVIEKTYSVEIPEIELLYIQDIIKQKTEFPELTQEF